jgi:hypothetical protein
MAAETGAMFLPLTAPAGVQAAAGAGNTPCTSGSNRVAAHPPIKLSITMSVGTNSEMHLRR